MKCDMNSNKTMFQLDYPFISKQVHTFIPKQASSLCMKSDGTRSNVTFIVYPSWRVSYQVKLETLRNGAPHFRDSPLNTNIQHPYRLAQTVGEAPPL